MARSIREGRDELTPEEAHEYVAERVREELGISLEEFMRLAEDGNLPDDPAVAHLVLLTGARPSSC
jgi:hypothetical protein